jgi:hypothetical protein
VIWTAKRSRVTRYNSSNDSSSLSSLSFLQDTNFGGFRSLLQKPAVDESVKVLVAHA